MMHHSLYTECIFSIERNLDPIHRPACHKLALSNQKILRLHNHSLSSLLKWCNSSNHIICNTSNEAEKSMFITNACRLSQQVICHFVDIRIVSEKGLGNRLVNKLMAKNSEKLILVYPLPATITTVNIFGVFAFIIHIVEIFAIGTISLYPRIWICKGFHTILPKALVENPINKYLIIPCEQRK